MKLKTYKLKRVLIGLLLTIVFFTGCSQQELIPETPPTIDSGIKEIQLELIEEDTEEEVTFNTVILPNPSGSSVTGGCKLVYVEETESIVASTTSPAMAIQETEPISSNLEVHFIDVGQGDAVLIKSDDKAMLIDGGDNSASQIMYTYLKKHGITELEYVIATHGHADHVGGLSGALEYAKAKRAFSSTLNYDSKTFQNFVDRLDVPLEIPELNTPYQLGNATFEILGPAIKFNDENNNSLVIMLTNGNHKFLFTGDAEREAEQSLLDTNQDIKADVLHVGHHGSDTSTIYPFLREVMPTYSVITCGKDNRYGHPHEGPLSRLRDAETIVLRTDLQGDIVFKSDGINLTYSVDRNMETDTIGNINPITWKLN